MRKSLSLLPMLIVALVFVALPAHAQFDSGLDWKLNQVQNVQFVSGGCSEDMSADQCMASGYAPGMSSCAAVRCTRCGNNNITGTAGCYLAAANGSCKCTVTTTYYPASRTTVTYCQGEGACTYQL